MRLPHLCYWSAVSTAAVALGFTAAAQADTIKTVFVIAMENHNWTQPASDLTAPGQIFLNPNAPFINSLVNGTSSISSQVSFANEYHNVLATPSGGGPSIHPSEPNYIWMEAGSNLGVLNDNDPYKVPGGTNQTTTNHLSTLLTNAGVTWKSYQEDIDTDAAGNVLPKSQWTSPITSRSGTYTTVANAYNAASSSTTPLSTIPRFSSAIRTAAMIPPRQTPRPNSMRPCSNCRRT